MQTPDSPWRPEAVWQRLKRFARYWYLRLMRIQATPHALALGMAIGVFVGFIPLLPSQTVIAIGFAYLLRASKAAAAIGTLVSNPFNWVPLYMLFYYLGRAVVPFDIPALTPSHLNMAELAHTGWRFYVAMITGGLIIAIPASVLSYFLMRKGVLFYREQKAKRAASRNR